MRNQAASASVAERKRFIMILCIGFGYGIEPGFQKVAFARFVEITGKDVVFYEIEFSVFRDHDVEPSVVVDNDRTERFYRGLESFGDFIMRQPSDFPAVSGYAYYVFGQTLAFVHFDDVHPLFRLRPKHPYFVVRGIELFEGGIRFLSPFLKLRYRYEEVVGILGIAYVEGEYSFASGVPVDFQDDVSSNAVFASEKVPKFSGI